MYVAGQIVNPAPPAGHAGERVRVSLYKAIDRTLALASKHGAADSQLALLEWRAAGMFETNEETGEQFVSKQLYEDILNTKVNPLPEGAEDAQWQSRTVLPQRTLSDAAGSTDIGDSRSTTTDHQLDWSALLNKFESNTARGLQDFPQQLALNAMPFGRHLFNRANEGKPTIQRWFSPYSDARVARKPDYGDMDRSVVAEGVLQTAYLIDELPYTRAMQQGLRPFFTAAGCTALAPDLLLDMVRGFYGLEWAHAPHVEELLDDTATYIHHMNFARFADPLNKPVLILMSCTRPLTVAEQLALVESHFDVDLFSHYDPMLFYNNNQLYLIPNERSGARSPQGELPLAWVNEHRLQDSEEYRLANQYSIDVVEYIEAKMRTWVDDRYLNAPQDTDEPIKQGDYLDWSPLDYVTLTTRGTESAPGDVGRQDAGW